MSPPRFATLVEMLELRASECPDRAAVLWQDEPLTYARLWQGSGRFAAGLRKSGVGPGQRVVLALPNGLEFFVAFYGVLRAGATAVPLAPESGVERVLAIAKHCAAPVVVVADDLEPDRRRYWTSATGGDRPRLTTVADSDDASTEGLPRVEPEDVAFIQYTSGSTGDPKGVLLSHANLVCNIGQLTAGLEIEPREVFVSWLPVHHDMGLILMTMVPFALAARLHLMPTSVRSIIGWMSSIAHHRATFTAAPDFAYRLCLSHLKEHSAPDLESLRVALNAAEPVRTSTLERFARLVDGRAVMTPAYGLAEATVGVSSWTPGSPWRADDRGFVSVGRPFPGVEVTVEDDGQRVEAGQVGEIVVSSPATTRGYLDNPEATRRLLAAPGAIRTGDLGYQDRDGNLYVVGRLKNIIIQAGLNIAPQEVEEAVDELPFVRRSAAIGIDRGRREGEQVYVFTEVKSRTRGSEAALHELASEVVQAVHSRLGWRPGRVYLVAPHALPMTANGKLQHALLKRQYLDGSLRHQGHILFPEY